MTSTVNNGKTAALIALALAIAALGIYLAYADDPSLTGLGPSGIGLLLMAVGVVLGVRVARHRLPAWAARTVLAVGVLTAVIAAFVIHVAAVTAALFPQLQDVPSVVESAPSPQYAAAVERARELVRAAVLEQNLPGVSVAVGAGLPAGALAPSGLPAGASAQSGLPAGASAQSGLPAGALAKAGGTIVWAEGFGWRDVDTRTPVTTKTRFNIGTAASAVTAAAVAPLGLTSTGAESAAEWSPEHIGEPEEDFPGFTIIRHLIFQPIGLAPAEYPLPGDRATFYAPRSDDNDLRRGRRLMYMRDLACCADGKAFYSTPSDLARFALATRADSVNGELAGGSVMSLMTRGDRGIVVAVTSNVAHANTAALALKVADEFTEHK